MSAGSFETYVTIVEQAEQLVTTSLSEPICVAILSDRIGVSQRRLRSAFHAVHQSSPYRFLRGLRLAEARRVLLTIDPNTAMTVTKIATDHGFVELGRFAVEYRMAFGESPSTTLNRSQSLD